MSVVVPRARYIVLYVGGRSPPYFTLEKELIMTKLTLNTQKLTASAMVLGLASIAGPVAAQQFTISATVQNAVEIDEVAPLNFGTIFATSTAAGGATTNSSVITLTAAGVVSSKTIAAAPVISLGGTTPGSFTIPSLPIGSTIYIDIQDSEGDSITNATVSAAATTLTCAYSEAVDAITANKIVLTAGGPGNGNFEGFFCVDKFTASIGATDQTAALVQQTTTAGTGYLVPGAGAGTVAFTLGASIVASSGTTAVDFGTGAYSGIFNMEVNFK